MKAARFNINAEMLRDIFMFPQNVELRNVTWNPLFGVFEVSLVGDGLPDECKVVDGNAVAVIRPQYAVVDEKPQFIGFNPSR